MGIFPLWPNQRSMVLRNDNLKGSSKMFYKFNIISFIILITLVTQNLLAQKNIPSSQRSVNAINRVEDSLKQQLNLKGLKYGSPVFVRIFKESSNLEIWVENGNKTYSLFKTYKICNFSGDLGPKTKQGDWQSPEGFYFVTPNQLNPWSSYHLSFNLGYPNRYDRAYKRTGSALMVHGNCVSIGCYAMTDKYIDEIYALVNAALENGQSFFRVHAFPFKLDDTRLEKEKGEKWYSFWKNLKDGYDYFEENKVPPNVTVKNMQYVFE